MQNEEKKYDLIKFEDGELSLDVRVEPNQDTVWLTQKDMAYLFDVDRTRITRHINKILEENELPSSVCAENALTASDGKVYTTKYYNLDMIIAVGYRVNSKRGTQFRRWVNSILKEYLLKGYIINEDRCLACSTNLISLENKYNNLESRMNNAEEIIYSKNAKIIFEGEIVEPYTFIRHIFFLAKNELIITDFYADNYLISMLKDIKVKITIITSTNSYLNKINIPNNVNIIHNDNIHGRYIFIDDKYVYALDNSFNNIGKKEFIIMKLDNITKEMILQERKRTDTSYQSYRS